MPAIKIGTSSPRPLTIPAAGDDGNTPLACSPLAKPLSMSLESVKSVKKALKSTKDFNNNNNDCIASRPVVVTPDVTLNEDFLPEFKLLKPVLSATNLENLPNPADVLKISPKKRLIVGISGVSCGGKTTVSRALHNWLGDHGDLIMQDDYYLPPAQLPINSFTNFPEFDEPESVKMDDIVRDVLAWKLEGECAVTSDDDCVDEKRVLILEGTMIFTNPELLELCDLRYMIHVDFETAEYRRSLRNYPIPDPPLIVAKHIWPKYIKHRNVFQLLASDYNLICKQINGTHNVNQIVMGIVEDVKVSKHG